MIEPSKGRANDTYSVVFTPYGTGPGGPGHTLVIRIETASPSKVAAKPLSLDGQNALVDVTRLPKGSVANGGRYKGTLVLIAGAGFIIPTLTEVSPLK